MCVCLKFPVVAYAYMHCSICIIALVSISKLFSTFCFRVFRAIDQISQQSRIERKGTGRIRRKQDFSPLCVFQNSCRGTLWLPLFGFSPLFFLLHKKICSVNTGKSDRLRISACMTEACRLRFSHAPKKGFKDA